MKLIVLQKTMGTKNSNKSELHIISINKFKNILSDRSFINDLHIRPHHIKQGIGNGGTHIMYEFCLTNFCWLNFDNDWQLFLQFLFDYNIFAFSSIATVTSSSRLSVLMMTRFFMLPPVDLRAIAGLLFDV